jgi:RNA polymerase sigma-70 factor (ECF subfamily)
MLRRHPTPPLSTDFDLEVTWQRARRLDRDALIRLHEHYYPQVYRYIRFRLDEPQVCEDLTAEVFLRFLEAVNRHRLPRRNLPTWLFKTCAELVERILLQPNEGKSTPAASPVAGGREGGEWGWLIRRYRKAFRQLRLEGQHFLALRFSEKRSLEETAKLLGRSEREARSLQLGSLAELLAALGGGQVAQRDESSQRALQVCLQGLETGGELNDLVASFPKWSGELRRLLEVARLSYNLPGFSQTGESGLENEGLPASADAIQHSQAELVQVARRMAPRSPLSWVGGRLGRALLLGIGLALILGVCLWAALGTLSGTLPGSPLFPLKLSEEQLRLVWTRDPVRRLELERRYDMRRLEEVKELLRLGRAERVEFSADLEEMQAGEWLVGGVRVQVPGDAQIVGAVRGGFSVTVQGETEAGGAVVAQRLQMREVVIQGQVESLVVGQLVVKGLEIGLSAETLFVGSPAVGNQVSVRMLLPPDGRPQARLVEVLN